MGEFSIKRRTEDGYNLYFQWWTPEQTKAVICLVHGLGEHSSRYQNFAKLLLEQGFAVIAVDLHGHGQTDGKRGYAVAYEVLMNDIALLVKAASFRFPDVPQFLYGHSMGGNLVTNYVLRNSVDIKGVIISAPWLQLAQRPPFIQLVLAYMMGYIAPKFSQSNGIDINALSHDPDVIAAYKDDPLVHDQITVGLFKELYQAGKWALKHASSLSIPALIMHGTDDLITSYKASKKFADRAADVCTFKQWPGYYHEIHNEPQGEKVIKYAVEWANQYLSV